MAAKEVVAGRKAYVAKCAKSHPFCGPTKHSEADWRAWMEKMSRKSELKGEQASALSRHLGAFRAGGLPAKPEDKPKPSRGNKGDGDR